MQVDPIKATLKAPGSKRLILKYDELLSSFAFNFNLRRHSRVRRCHPRSDRLHPVDVHGKTVQVDPIKPTLTAPITQRFKLKYDKLLSSFAFKFKLRRYKMDFGIVLDMLTPEYFIGGTRTQYTRFDVVGWCQGLTLIHVSAEPDVFVTKTAHHSLQFPQ